MLLPMDAGNIPFDLLEGELGGAGRDTPDNRYSDGSLGKGDAARKARLDVNHAGVGQAPDVVLDGADRGKAHVVLDLPQGGGHLPLVHEIADEFYDLVLRLHLRQYTIRVYETQALI